MFHFSSLSLMNRKQNFCLLPSVICLLPSRFIL